MPRGTNPNSLANLKKGKATQFGAHGDSTAKAAQKISAQVQGQRKSIAEEMRELLEAADDKGNTRRKALAAKLVVSMEKSPEWYKLGLRMIGELPAEQVEVSKPKVEMAEEIAAALAQRQKELEAK